MNSRAFDLALGTKILCGSGNSITKSELEHQHVGWVNRESHTRSSWDDLRGINRLHYSVNVEKFCGRSHDHMASAIGGYNRFVSSINHVDDWRIVKKRALGIVVGPFLCLPSKS